MEETIYTLFKKQVLERPDGLAVVDEMQKVSFEELDKMADAIIAKFPAESPKFVGIVMNHSVEMIAAILAVLKTGAAYVPVEPTFPVERIRYMMQDSKVDFVITHHEYSGLLGGLLPLFIERGMKTDLPAVSSTETKATARSLAYVLYTSGTTGTPKGVMVNNGNVCHYVRAFKNEFQVKEGDVMLQYSVCSFDIFVEEVFTTLLNGAALAIPSEEAKSDIRKLMQFVEDNHVTEISGFPYLLLEMNKLDSIPHCLRLLISGGDVLRASYINRLVDKVEIYNTYGPSETTVCASYYRCNAVKPLTDGTYPIGKAVLGTAIEILNDNLQPVTDGESGEICIFGDGISQGYIKQNPESANFACTTDGRRVYRSGDLGYRLPDGNIAFLHRKDKQVMILGKRVECDEVENVLCACNEVERGVVCPYTDTQGLSYLVAYIVPRTSELSIGQLKRKLSKFLTSYMIPEYFVAMPTIPLTTNGKIDRQALPVILKEGSL